MEASSAARTRSPPTSGRTVRRAKAYGVFDEEQAPRARHVPDRQGRTVVWSLVNDDTHVATELAPAPLAAAASEPAALRVGRAGAPGARLPARRHGHGRHFASSPSAWPSAST
jgi:hypothetical protein